MFFFVYSTRILQLNNKRTDFDDYLFIGYWVSPFLEELEELVTQSNIIGETEAVTNVRESNHEERPLDEDQLVAPDAMPWKRNCSILNCREIAQDQEKRNLVGRRNHILGHVMK